MDLLERQAFDLGWDFATFELDVPEAASASFCDGYRAFRHGNNKTVKQADRYVRKWLQIRFGALARGKEFSLDVTPKYLSKITPRSGRCPVIEKPFTHGKHLHTDWSVDRANNDRGYVRGNIIIVSVAANAAKSDKSLEDMRALGNQTNNVHGLTPAQWRKFSILVAPAFGEGDDESNPIQVLNGQPIALGMPVSPIASFQVAVARALVDGWDPKRREVCLGLLGVIAEYIVRNQRQRRAMDRLVNEVIRRSRHLRSYSEIWATKRIQRRLNELLDALGNPGLRRLSELQELTLGGENTRLA